MNHCRPQVNTFLLGMYTHTMLVVWGVAENLFTLPKILVYNGHIQTVQMYNTPFTNSIMRIISLFGRKIGMGPE